MQKVLVAPHLSGVSALAMIITAGIKTQGAVTKVEGALAPISFMDLKKVGHFDEVIGGLTAEHAKIPDRGGYPGQARKLVSEMISTVQTMKRTFDTALAAGGKGHAPGNGLDEHAGSDHAT